MKARQWLLRMICSPHGRSICYHKRYTFLAVSPRKTNEFKRHLGNADCQQNASCTQNPVLQPCAMHLKARQLSLLWRKVVRAATLFRGSAQPTLSTRSSWWISMSLVWRIVSSIILVTLDQGKDRRQPIAPTPIKIVAIALRQETRVTPIVSISEAQIRTSTPRKTGQILARLCINTTLSDVIILSERKPMIPIVKGIIKKAPILRCAHSIVQSFLPS